MKIENNFILCSAEELAKLVVKEVNECHMKSRKKYNGYDFVLADYVELKESENLERLADEFGCWYGIHSIDTGFDSEGMTLCCDYYGGGYDPQFVTCWDELEDDDLENDVTGAILRTLDSNEGAHFTNETVIICEKVLTE